MPIAIGVVGSVQSNLQLVRAFQSLSCAPPPTANMLRRQSARLKQPRTRSISSNADPSNETKAAPTKKPRKSACPLRTREAALEGFQVMGIDEAGRGPLAGPVVAAAAIVPCSLEGIMDS